MVAFDRWLRAQLAERLDWSWAGEAREKRIEQCRLQVEGLVLALWRRGWMLDGRRLADRLTAMLDAVGKAQRAGQVRDFWPYFRSTCQRYVGLNAEEIQAEARSAGATIGALVAAITAGGPAKAATLPELVAQRADETLRAKVARQRRQEAGCAADARQLPLL